MSHEKTFNQISDQEHDGHAPSVLIERTDGRIHPASLASNMDDHGRRWAWFTDQDGLFKGKPITIDHLSDEYQASLANNLALSAERPLDEWQRSELRQKGKSALDAVGIEPPDFSSNAISRDELNRFRSEREESREDARARELFSFPDANKSTMYGTSLKERTTVTEDSLKDAALAFRYARQDEDLKQLFDEYKGNAWRDEDMAKVLRENDDLRIALGKHFLSRLDTMRRLPERVRRNAANNKKNPNFPGFERPMESREYSALLALSMLDGTFKSARNVHDRIIKNEYQEVDFGQHRYAAMMLLGTDRFI